MRSSILLLLLASVAVPGSSDQPAATPERKAPPAAAEQAGSPPPKLKEAIVVTATRSERAVSEVPVSVTVVTEEQIRQTPAANVDDLLRTLPGVQMPLSSVSAQQTSMSEISIRGLGDNRALVLVDGIPIHDPYYGSVEWQKVPLDDLRQVEVVRGASGSLFGNYALGGAVNLITRPVDSSLVRAEASWGSADTDRRVLTVEQMLTPRLGLRLSHHASDSNGFFRQPVPGPIDIRAWNDTSLTSARAEYRTDGGTTMFLRANHGDIGMSNGTPLTRNERELADVAAGLQHPLGSASLLSVSLFHQTNDDHLVSSTIPSSRLTESMAGDSHVDSNGTGGSVEVSFQRSGAIPFVSLGLDVQEVEAVEHRDAYTRGVFQRSTRIEARQQFAGLFGQASWQPSPRLEVLTSARLDRYSNRDASETVIGGDVTAYPDARFTELNPRISARYALGGRAAVRGSVYRGFKAPNMRDLYRNSQSGSTILLGNPFLGPETLVGAEAGFEWALPKSRFEIVLYRADVEGLMARGPVPGEPPNVVKYYNLGTSRAQGVEFAANASLSRHWSLDAGYTFADSFVTDDPDPALVGKRLPKVPKHYGSFSLRYHADRGAAFTLRGRIVSRTYGEPTNAVPGPAHRVFDVSASYPVRAWLDVYALAENVLDEKYFMVLTPTAFRAAQPRTVTAGLRVRMPSPWRTDS